MLTLEKSQREEMLGTCSFANFIQNSNQKLPVGRAGIAFPQCPHWRPVAPQVVEALFLHLQDISKGAELCLGCKSQRVLVRWLRPQEDLAEDKAEDLARLGNSASHKEFPIDHITSWRTDSISQSSRGGKNHKM